MKKLSIPTFLICIALFLSFGSLNAWAKSIGSLEQLNSPEYRIGLPQGAASMYTGEKVFSNAELVYYSSLAEGYTALEYGKLDGFVFDSHALEYVAANNEKLGVFPESLGEESIVIGAAFGSEELVKKVNTFIDKYKNDGTYDDMYRRWMKGEDTQMPEIEPAENPSFTLTVGTEGMNEPMNYYGENGELTGFDVEFIQRLAKDIGAKVEIKAMTFDALIASAASGKIDLLVANLNGTPAVKEQMMLSDSYINSQISVLVRSEDMPEDAPKESGVGLMDGESVGVMTGSTGESFVKTNSPTAQLNSYDNIGDAMLALQSGKLKYVVTAYTTALNFIKADPQLYIEQDNLLDESVAIAVQKENTELLQKINDVLAEFRENGTLDEIIERWTKTGSSMPELPEISVLESAPILRVAIAANREPMCFVYEGEYTGLDCELIERIAYELGMRVEYSDMNFSALVMALQSGKADAVISNMTPTAERMETVSFTENYFQNPQVLVAKGNTSASSSTEQTASPKYKNLEELAGKRLGVVTGSSFDKHTQKYVKDAEIVYLTNYSDLVTAILADKIDAYLMDEPIARMAVMQNSENITYLPEIILEESYGFAVTKSTKGAALKEKINEFIEAYKNDGRLEKLDAKWFGEDETVKTSEAYDNLPGTNGNLIIAVTATLAPFSFQKDNRIVGYDIDMIVEFCKEQGYSLEIMDVEPAASIVALSTGKVDMVAGCLTITEERKQSVDFATPNYEGGVVAVVPLEKNLPALGVPKYSKVSELEGKTLGALTGTAFFEKAAPYIPNMKSLYFNDLVGETEAVRTGKVEAILLDEPVARLLTAQISELAIIEEPVEKDRYGFALAKGSPLTEEINAVIKEFREDGTLSKLEEKWFSEDESGKTLPQLDFSKAEGTLRVAHDSVTVPMSYVGDGGDSLGYDVELAMRIAHKLNKNIELISMDFNGLISAISGGKADMAAGCMSITDERKKSVDMTEPYYEGGVVAVVKRGETTAKATGDEKGFSAFISSLKTSFERNFIVEERWKLILEGTGITLLISVLSAIFGTLLGFGVCMLRRMRNALLSGIAKVFIRAVQGTPIVVFLMILYYVIFGSSDISAIWVAVIGFAINFAAYVSEMIRTGIDAVDKGQIEAAQAIGYSRIRTFFKITFPQAARHFLPVYKGEFISLVKMTSVVGYIAIQDLTKMSDIIRSRTYEAFFPLIATAVIYFILAYLLTLVLNFIEFKIDPKRRKRKLKGVKED